MKSRTNPRDCIDLDSQIPHNRAMLKQADFDSNSGAENWVPALSIEKYFTQDFSLSIPPWQREYTWDSSDNDGQVPVLLEDLRSFIENPEKKEYLIGAIILCDTDAGKEKHLIDGQQRTLTLYLLMMCCEKFLRMNKIYSGNDYLFQARLHKMINSADIGFTPRVKFNQENANLIMTKIHDWAKADSVDADKWLDEIESYSQTQKNLLTVTKYFYKELTQDKWISREKLIAGVEKILKNVKVIQLSLDNQSEAIEVFDRINHRGMQLSGADLIKNQIFQMVPDASFEEISNNWQSMVETLRKNKSTKLQDPKYLLRAHAWTIWKSKVTYDDLADKYVKEYFKSNDPADFSENLKDYAEALGGFAELNHLSHGPLAQLMPAKFLGSVQHYPVLLAGNGIKKKDSFLHLYKQVSARTALYVFSQERPPKFESIIPTWANAVREAGAEVTVSQLNDIFKAAAPFPEDMIAQMRTNIASWSYGNGSDKKKIRAAISYMSFALDSMLERKFEVSQYFDTKKPRKKPGWDLDHIEPTAAKTNTLSPELKNSIGNLVLLSPPDNRAAKNTDAFDKLSYYDNSVLYLTKTVTDTKITPKADKIINELLSTLKVERKWNLENWDDDSVLSRVSFYSEFLTALVTLQLEIPSDPI
jgi:hypothetical protein